ncbi:MAG: sterol desaturase family protein, partial [Rhodococcus sp.]
MRDQLASAWNSLPEPLRDPVALAVPAFALLLTIEWIAAKKLEDGTPGAYSARDARASLSMGLVSIATTTAWKALALIGYTAIYVYIAPWHLPADAWYTWVILILGVDLLFYGYHRIAHRTRLIWATHQAHHSSEYFNFAAALRQKWNNSGEIIMWLPLPLLGMPPWMVFVGFSINLVYQFWVHT